MTVRAITDEDFETNEFVRESFEDYKKQAQETGSYTDDEAEKEGIKKDYMLYTGEVNVSKDAEEIFEKLKQKHDLTKLRAEAREFESEEEERDYEASRAAISYEVDDTILELMGDKYGLSITENMQWEIIPFGNVYSEVQGLINKNFVISEEARAALYPEE